MKKLFALIPVAALMVACGGSTPEAENPEAAQTPAAPAEEAAPAAEEEAAPAAEEEAAPAAE